MDKTYCSKSVDKKCKNIKCPRNLNGFFGMYISLAEFNCEEVLDEIRDEKTREDA